MYIGEKVSAPFLVLRFKLDRSDTQAGSCLLSTAKAGSNLDRQHAICAQMILSSVDQAQDQLSLTDCHRHVWILVLHWYCIPIRQ